MRERLTDLRDTQPRPLRPVDIARAQGMTQALGIQMGIPPRRDDIPEPPKTPDEIEYAKLSNNAIRYLSDGKSSRDPLITQESRDVHKANQIRNWNEEMSEEERKALIGYITWRQENIIAPLRRRVEWMEQHRIKSTETTP